MARTLKDMTEQIPSLSFVTESLQILSGAGRRALRSVAFMSDADEISVELSHLDDMTAVICNESLHEEMERLKLKLMQVRDITGTIRNLESGNTLDDIEFFELKKFAMLSRDIRKIIEIAGLSFINIPDTDKVIEILDPANSGIAHFYIYDIYDSRLPELRKRLKLNAEAEAGSREELMDQMLSVEDEVRIRLSAELRCQAKNLAEGLDNTGYLDLLLAKTLLAKEMNLKRPEIIKSGCMIFTGLFNPQVAEALGKEGKHFQAVDISLKPGATVITGANMAGKSVLLKTLALAQAMSQFGFYVPANTASLIPMDDILISIGDDQSELKGLSSYGAEMMRINDILNLIEEGSRALVLIDEPARTTNPTEGKALVAAICSLLNETQSYCVVTTHYSGVGAGCRRLRVRGFEREMEEGSLRVADINGSIDYSLEEDSDDRVPHEALRIARMLGVNRRLTELAEKILIRDMGQNVGQQ